MSSAALSEARVALPVDSTVQSSTSDRPTKLVKAVKFTKTPPDRVEILEGTYGTVGSRRFLLERSHIQIKGSTSAILSVKDQSGVWWDSGALAPNSADFYHDVSAFGWEITEAAITNVAGAGAAPQLGGIYFRMP